MVLSILSAFLAGGIVLNVMKEELPEEREQLLCLFYRNDRVYSFTVASMKRKIE